MPPRRPSNIPVRALALAICAAAALGQAPPAAAKGQWAVTGQLAVGRGEHTATLLASGRVLVTGGRVEDSTSTASAEAFDPVTGRWGTAGSMTVARSFHTATRLADNRVLVAGGLVTSSATPAADLFNPAASPGGAWAGAPPLTTARSRHTATLLADGRVLVAAGLDANGMPTASVEMFDPAGGGGAGAWTAGPSLTLARAHHTATPLVDGRVLVAGGTTCVPPPFPACPTEVAEIFDPAAGGGAGGWTSVAAGAARYDHVAVRLPGGDVLVAGGLDGFPSLRRSAEVLRVGAAGGPAWAEANPMRVARANFAAALLPDGRVLVTGGGTGNTVDEQSSETWNPSTSGWSDAPAMPTARRGHTLTALLAPGCATHCGKLLVAGGVRNLPGSYLASAHLYDPNASATAYPLPAASRPPGAVRDLTARALSTSRVSLAFSAPGSPPARSYVVKQSRARITGADTFGRARSLCGGICRFAPQSAGGRLTLTVGGLRPRTTYFYALRAVGEDGRQYPTSNVASATTRLRRPGRVRGLRVRALSRTRLRVSFLATGAPPARRYVVKQARGRITTGRAFRRARSLCRGSCRFRVAIEGRRVALLVTRLRPGSTYCYAVRARYGGRLAPRSRSACARTRGPRRAAR